MSALIRDLALADAETELAAEAPLPAGGRVILPLARWETERANPAHAALQVGVRIPNTADVVALWPLLQDRPLLVLEFPAFSDGRAYSQARLLRDRLGYKGEIRATGAAVVLDQIQGMQRCGINAFQLRADQDAQACLRLLGAPPLAYQPAADTGNAPVLALRRA